jgi:GMP synthase (glutamine-hydrolysing)
MMRLGESRRVMEFLDAEGMKNLMVADAEKDFLDALEGVTLRNRNARLSEPRFSKSKTAKCRD